MWIEQPYKSRLCGQIAVSVITNLHLKDIIQLLGRNGTSTKKLVRVLRRLGYTCPDKLKKMPRPSLGIAKLKDPERKSGWHWVAVDGDKIFDGINGTPEGKVHWPKSWRMTSFLPITTENVRFNE